MNQMRQLIGGLMLGAAFAYLFDPDSGRRRRALVRDKGNRAARAKTDNPTDEVLEARVRSQLGRVITHPHAVTVEACDGTVTLCGPICADELSTALRMAGGVRGVKEVVNAMEPHEHSEHVPSLPGSRRKTARNLHEVSS